MPPVSYQDKGGQGLDDEACPLKDVPVRVCLLHPGVNRFPGAVVPAAEAVVVMQVV